MEEIRESDLATYPKDQCWCGKPIHYTDMDLLNLMEGIIEQHGSFVPVLYLGDGKVYMIQRHFIALHGLKGIDIPTLGFPVTDRKPEVQQPMSRIKK